jgi:hypothetical protein
VVGPCAWRLSSVIRMALEDVVAPWQRVGVRRSDVEVVTVHDGLAAVRHPTSVL